MLRKSFKEIDKKCLFFLIVIFVCSLRIIFSYSAGTNRYDCYDFLEGVRWAQGTIAEKGFPLSNKIAYYYTVPFGSNYLIAPFLLLNLNLLLSNQLGMFVWFLIYLSSLYCLSISLFDDINKRIKFCSISLLWVFLSVGDNMLHHLLVYGISLVCFNFLFSIGLQIKDRTISSKECILIFVLSILSSLNGIASFALSVLPFIVAFIVYRIVVLKRIEDVKKIIYVALIGAFFGLVVYYSVNIGIESYGESRLALATGIDIVVEKFKSFASTFSMNFWIIEKNTTCFVLSIICTFAFFLVLIICMAKLTVKNNIFLLAGVVIVDLICLAQYFLMNESSERSFFNLIVLSLCIVVYCLSDLRFKDYQKILAYIVMFGFVLYSQFAVIPRNAKKYIELEKMVNTIISNDLYEGYSRMYQYPLGIVSNDKIKIFTYDRFDRSLGAMMYLENNENSRVSGEGDFFFIVEKVKISFWNFNTSFLETLDVIYENNDFVIYKVSKNYSNNILNF